MVHYRHSDCGGSIGILNRRCSKCRKRWPFKVLFQYPLPGDLYIYRKGEIRLKKKTSTYAEWANKYPQVKYFAGRLPNWPRWARILTFLAILVVFAFLSYKLWGLFIQWIH